MSDSETTAGRPYVLDAKLMSELGIITAINDQVLHPLGLALYWDKDKINCKDASYHQMVCMSIRRIVPVLLQREQDSRSSVDVWMMCVRSDPQSTVLQIYALWSWTS